MEEAKTSKRAYRSALRSEQAAATRSRLLVAAQEAFSSRGYPGATIEDIAAAAGVSVPAVYWTFGNKQKLLRAVLEGVGADVRLGPRIADILAEHDPCRQLHLIAELASALWQAGATLLRGVERARGTDPTFDAWFREIDEERRRGQRPVVERLARRGQLRSGASIDEGTDLLFVLSGPSLYLQLVEDRGWAITAYEIWLTRLLCQTLLRPDLPCRRSEATSPLDT